MVVLEKGYFLSFSLGEEWEPKKKKNLPWHFKKHFWDLYIFSPMRKTGRYTDKGIGLAKKFVRIFPSHLAKNLNKLFGQHNTPRLCPDTHRCCFPSWARCFFSITADWLLCVHPFRVLLLAVSGGQEPDWTDQQGQESGSGGLIYDGAQVTWELREPSSECESWERR